MNDIEIWRSRYDARPRAIEKQMVRLARGDRGCLFDAISALGALLTAALFILANLEMLPQQSFWLGVMVWAGGFISGTMYQLRDGKRRKAALRDGLFTLGWVLEVDPEFATPAAAKRAMRGLVLFATDASNATDVSRLSKAASAWRKSLGKSQPAALPPALQTVTSDAFCSELVAIPEELIDLTGYAVARAVLYPNRLLSTWDTQRPVVGLIVSPEAKFIEQVPGND